MSDYLKQIITEISSHAKQGRWQLHEAPEEEEQENPLGDEEEGGQEDPLGGDPLASGDMPGGDMGNQLGDMGDMGDMGDDEEDAKDSAEAEKAKAEAEAAKAEAEAAKAEADKEKSEAEREKAEAEAEEFNGVELFSRPGTAFLVGQLLDDYSEENKLDQLAQQFVTKLKLDDEGFQKFKADSGPLLKLQGFQQLINRMEDILQTSTDQDVEDATENN